MNPRRFSTDVPDMSPTLRRGSVVAKVQTGIFLVNVFGKTVVAILVDGRTAPVMDADVDVEWNPVVNQWRLI